jgi:hypothetical protein
VFLTPRSSAGTGVLEFEVFRFLAHGLLDDLSVESHEKHMKKQQSIAAVMKPIA